MNEETLLEQMTRVRPEVLDENTLKLFNKIMKVIDERDDFHQRLIAVNKMNEDNYNKYCEELKKNRKAIEYLNEKWIEGSDIYSHFSAGCDCGNCFDFEEDRKELLEILGGDVDDE